MGNTHNISLVNMYLNSQRQKFYNRKYCPYSKVVRMLLLMGMILPLHLMALV